MDVPHISIPCPQPELIIVDMNPTQNTFHVYSVGEFWLDPPYHRGPGTVGGVEGTIPSPYRVSIL